MALISGLIIGLLDVPEITNDPIEEIPFSPRSKSFQSESSRSTFSGIPALRQQKSGIEKNHRRNNQLMKVHIHILKRPQNFAKPPPKI